jgi:hydroxyacylglutathione hydrolase
MDTPLLISPIRAFSDNYIWVIYNQRYAAVIDPGDADPVHDFLAQHNLTLCGILITHHHADHTGGIKELVRTCDVPVFGPATETIPMMSRPVTETETVYLAPLQLTLQVIEVPGHTLGHIAYFGHGWLFSGDTLFGCGCGRLFEGTPAQMLTSLEKLCQLPATTQVFCAHEYTLANIAFALTVEPDNLILRARAERDRERVAQQQPTLPSRLDLEMATNPFLRCNEPTVRQHVQRYAGNHINHPVEIFSHLRQMKNHFHSS